MINILTKFEIETLPQIDTEHLHKTSVNNICTDEILLYSKARTR